MNNKDLKDPKDAKINNFLGVFNVWSLLSLRILHGYKIILVIKAIASTYILVKMIYRSRHFVADLIRFCIAGAISVASHFFTLIFCVEILHFNPTFSSAIGFIVACSVNYTLLYYWAFASDGKHHILVARYLAVMSSTMALNVFIFWIFTNQVGTWYIYSQAIATCCSAGFSFVLNRHYTFS